MQRKDLIVEDEDKGRQQRVPLTAAVQRFTLSGSAEGSLTLPNLGPGVAVILTAGPQSISIEPAQVDTILAVNQSAVGNNPWQLVSGDVVRIGEVTLTYAPTDAAHRFIAATDAAASDQTTPPAEPFGQAVKPLTFEPRATGPAARVGRRTGLWLIFLSLPALVLGTAAWFVFTARQLTLDIQPPPEKITIRGGFMTPRFGEAYLLRPGHYQLQAERTGYQSLQTDFEIGADRHQTLTFAMQKLPGRVNLTTHREGRPQEAVTGAAVEINGRVIGRSPLEAAEVPAGRHPIRLQAPLYKPHEGVIQVAGEGRLENFAFGLAPNWADVTFATDPSGAWIEVSGRRMGRTPLTAPVEAGEHQVNFKREGYKPTGTRIQVVAGEPLEVPTQPLAKIDGRVFVTSRPPGANVTVGKTFYGQTPLEITLAPDREHVVRISEPGYRTAEHRLKIISGVKTSLVADLVPRRGRIRFEVSPPDARLVVDGQPYGRVPDTLELLAVTHQIRIVKEGYRDFTTRVTPRPGYALELRVKLKRPYETDVPGIIQATNGYRLKLIQTGPAFQMGSSRREQGRRANETLRQVRLRRPFYMGIKEVTNREFREFQAAHDAGIFKNYSLNRNEQPVVQITWEQAAAYCNWLSEREGLPPAYVPTKGGLAPVVPLNHGYRMPTEAEWAYCARVAADGRVTRYPWGNQFPPPDKTENLADRSAQTILNLYLEKYQDGHPVAAPPGSLSPNHWGLYDLGGNVSEWCHDYYKIYPQTQNQVTTDPSGPASGRHHVIRGGSWKQASIQTLRAAHRDYREKKRLDLGFRISRYVKPNPEGN